MRRLLISNAGKEASAYVSITIVAAAVIGVALGWGTAALCAGFALMGFFVALFVVQDAADRWKANLEEELGKADDELDTYDELRLIVEDAVITDQWLLSRSRLRAWLDEHPRPTGDGSFFLASREPGWWRRIFHRKSRPLGDGWEDVGYIEED
jgi:hypothetical protein